jgi:hypothetical protein
MIFNVINNQYFIGVYACSCEPHYLMFGSDCVHEDVIIGVTVGVGGAILIGLIVAVVVLVLKRPQNKTDKQM